MFVIHGIELTSPMSRFIPKSFSYREKSYTLYLSLGMGLFGGEGTNNMFQHKSSNYLKLANMFQNSLEIPFSLKNLCKK